MTDHPHDDHPDLAEFGEMAETAIKVHNHSHYRNLAETLAEWTLAASPVEGENGQALTIDDFDFPQFGPQPDVSPEVIESMSHLLDAIAHEVDERTDNLLKALDGMGLLDLAERPGGMLEIHADPATLQWIAASTATITWMTLRHVRSRLNYPVSCLAVERVDDEDHR